MSSSTPKVQTKTQAANMQHNEPKTSKSGTKVSAQQSGKHVSGKRVTDGSMNNCHDALKAIQHEYEQFQINMDEKD